MYDFENLYFYVIVWVLGCVSVYLREASVLRVCVPVCVDMVGWRGLKLEKNRALLWTCIASLAWIIGGRFKRLSLYRLLKGTFAQCSWYRLAIHFTKSRHSSKYLEKSVVFCVITRRRVVIIYWRFGTTCRSHLHGSRFRVGKKNITLILWHTSLI
jgi:hypothetical protein